MALPEEKLALWGGIECTVNRVGDAYFDQLARAGHKERATDLHRIAELGIRKLRYPVLWEHVCPSGDPAKADWSWHDERMNLMRSLNIDPIVGLLHHGSGPRNTDLLDGRMATGLRDFALSCARRYPWVRDYTPVNEPLTTARFSALYGFWYPHKRDTALFARALVNQCKAIALCMQAVRQVNPQARLIQTEDFGTVRSTKRLEYQAELDNQRRWLSLDLLCGRVDKSHPLYALLVQSTSEAEVTYFLDSPCPPDLIGVNYYVTSDRFLDHRLSKYPSHLHGGNGRDAYVDIEAVRTEVGMRGHAETLATVWERYNIPLAVTEVHLDCHREEQLRWLAEAWAAAKFVRSQGVDVQAITMWSLFGAYDWNSLCTRADGYYEPGAFDLRSDPPRPTALAKAAAALIAQGSLTHPTLNERGWWWRGSGAPTASRRASRNACPPPRPAGLYLKPKDESHPGQPLLIVGTGPIANALLQACDDRFIGNSLMNSAGALPTADALAAHECWAIVCASDDPDECREVAAFAHKHALPFALITEGGERTLQMVAIETCPRTLVVSTCALFGPGCAEGVVGEAVCKLLQGQRVVAPSDLTATPSYLPDVVRVLLDLLIDGEEGIWPLTNANSLSWAETLALLAAHLDVDAQQVVASTAAELSYAWPAAISDASRGQLMPNLHDAFVRFASATLATQPTRAVIRRCQ